MSVRLSARSRLATAASDCDCLRPCPQRQSRQPAPRSPVFPVFSFGIFPIFFGVCAGVFHVTAGSAEHGHPGTAVLLCPVFAQMQRDNI